MHVPSEVIAKYHPEWGAGLLGGKAHSAVFDNTKLKRLVPVFCARIPFHQGAKEIVKHHQEHPDLCQPDSRVDQLMDRLVSEFSPNAHPRK